MSTRTAVLLNQSFPEDPENYPQLNHSSVCDSTGYSGTEDLQKSAEVIARADGSPNSMPARKRSA
jgi:hypothetical protein